MKGKQMRVTVDMATYARLEKIARRAGRPGAGKVAADILRLASDCRRDADSPGDPYDLTAIFEEFEDWEIEHGTFYDSDLRTFRP